MDWSFAIVFISLDGCVLMRLDEVMLLGRNVVLQRSMLHLIQNHEDAVAICLADGML
jgi:hypothetical protein